MRQVLLYLTLKYNGDWDKIYEALDKQEKIPLSELELIEEKITCDFISLVDRNYPVYLKNTYKPPFVIFYKGNPNLLESYHKTIAVVGGSSTSEYSEQQLDKFIKDLTKEQRYISTFHDVGVCESVVNQCLKYNASMIMVVKEGIKPFIDEHKTLSNKLDAIDHLVLSEIFISKDSDVKSLNSYANRLLTGISKGIVFMPFEYKNTISKLANTAIVEGKEVFSIPERNGEMNGTNKLIKQGAKLSENIQDILNEL